jgi:hypothetical protein
VQHPPQDIVRHTVEQNGGSYSTDVADLLGLFGRENLTDKARAELTTALLDVGVGVEPHLFRVERDELVNLFLLDPERVPGSARGGGSVPPPAGAQHRPQDVARNTVEHYGGSHTTDVASLLALFGQENLTDRARAELTIALRDVGLAVEPDLFHVERDDLVNLFPVDSAPVPEPAVSRPVGGPVGILGAARQRGKRLVPRTWKGWLAYGVVALFVLVALTGDPDDGDPGGSPTPSSKDVAPETDNAEEAEARRLRRGRAAERRERARAQQARRRRAAARRERERQEALAAQRERQRQQALAEQRRQEEEEQRQQEQAAQCHPSYDPCLDPNASDYDCEGGSGDGPEYTGPVTVSGDDPYDLDRDGDGSACE